MPASAARRSMFGFTGTDLGCPLGQWAADPLPRAIGSRVQMWLKRLLGKGEKTSPSGRAPRKKETEQGREDRQTEFMNERVRQRDEDESHMQDKAP